MGLLDEAIREHLELKRQHGADEDEIARQEAEALGPVSVEELEAETSLDPLQPPDADEAASPDGPFDRAAEAGLTGERDTPSFEWHGWGSDEIEVPSFVPAEPEPGPASSSEPPADLEPPAKLETPADLEPPADVEPPGDPEGPDDLETPGDLVPPAPAERSAEEGGPPITDMPTELFEPLDVEGASGGDEPLESERLGDVGEFREDEARLEGEDPLPPPPRSDVDPLPGEPAFGAEDEVDLAPDQLAADPPAEVEPPLAEERAGLEPSIPVDDHEPLAEGGPMIEGEQALVEPEDLEPPEEPSVESLELDALDEPVEPVEPAPAQSSDRRPEEAPVTGDWPGPGPAFARDPVEEEPLAGDLSQEEPAPIEAPLDDSGFSGPVAESEARTMEPDPVEHAPLGEPPVDELGSADALARDEAIEEPLEETALYELPPAGGDPQSDEPLAEEPLADEPLAEESLAEESLADAPLAEHDVSGAPFAEEHLIEEESRDVSDSSIAESREPDGPAVPESAHRELSEALDPTGAEPSPEWGVVDQPTASFAVEEELAAGAPSSPELSSADPLEPEPLETEPEPLETEPEPLETEPDPLAGEPEPPGRAEPEDQLEDSLYLDEERNGPAEIIDDESADPESRSARGFFEDTVEHEGVRRGEGPRPDADFED